MSSLFTSVAPQISTLATPEWLDLAAVMVGSLFGALTACERKLDLVGAIGLGILCGLGGGLIRDTIMQVGNVYMIKSHLAIPSAIIASCIVFFFSGVFLKLQSLTAWIDIISVGLFAASGTDKAIVYDMTFIVCIFMGTLTGVGGGMLRDIFLGDVPHIFRRGNLYALCAVLGSVVYYLLCFAGLTKAVAAFGCVVSTAVLRWASLKYNILSPANVDFTPELLVPVRFLRRHMNKATDKIVPEKKKQHPAVVKLRKIAYAAAHAMNDPANVDTSLGTEEGSAESIFQPTEQEFENRKGKVPKDSYAPEPDKPVSIPGAAEKPDKN
jgi:uncharacterized membrane protein YeiH